MNIHKYCCRLIVPIALFPSQTIVLVPLAKNSLLTYRIEFSFVGMKNQEEKCQNKYWRCVENKENLCSSGWENNIIKKHLNIQNFQCLIYLANPNWNKKFISNKWFTSIDSISSRTYLIFYYRYFSRWNLYTF